jgi:hypothetical protein
MLLADSFWQRDAAQIGLAGAVAVGVITLLIMWLWRVRDRQSKTLDYRVISDTDIIISHNRPEKLKVVYGLEEVKDPRVTEIRFKNTGKQIIETDDFLEPVRMIMRRPNARILDYDVVEQKENHLYEKIELVTPEPDRPEHVQLFPRTLNSGDWFTVQLVYDGRGSSSDMAFTTRIKGETRKIATYTAQSDVAIRRRRVWMAIAGFGIYAGIYAILICVYFVTHSNTVLLSVASVFFVVAFFALVLAGRPPSSRLAALPRRLRGPAAVPAGESNRRQVTHREDL